MLRVEQEMFGGISLSPERANEMFAFRPEIYCVVVDREREGALAAYSSFFPLKRDCAEAFIAGDITEPELHADMMLAREDPHNQTYMYIGSVVIAGKHDPLIKAALLAAMGSWRIRQMQVNSIRRLTLIMLAATKEGEAMIRFARAKPLVSGASRRDGLTLYRRRLSMVFIYRAASMVERLLNSRVVQLDLNFTPEIAG